MTFGSLVGSTYTYTRTLDGTETEGTAQVDVNGTDLAGNTRNHTSFTSFATDFTAPSLSEITAVTTPTNDTTPNYTYNTDEAGTVTY